MKLAAPAHHTRPTAQHALRADLPRSATVLLLIDFVNPLGFPGSEQLEPAAIAAARAAAALKKRLCGQGLQAVYANDNYGTWHSDFGDVWRHCHSLGGASRRMATLLRPTRADLAILKPRHSAFFCTPLELLLGQLKARRLVLTGLAADICVLFTAMDAHVRGFKLWVPQDCIAAESEAAWRDAVSYMQRVLKADVRPSQPARRAAVR